MYSLLRTDIIGLPSDIVDSRLPTRRGVAQFIQYTRFSLEQCSSSGRVLDADVLRAVGRRLLALYKSRGFDHVTLRSIIRLGTAPI